jgi:hypothetical protein
MHELTRVAARSRDRGRAFVPVRPFPTRLPPRRASRVSAAVGLKLSLKRWCEGGGRPRTQPRRARALIRRQIRPQLQLDRMPPPIGEGQHEVMPEIAGALLFVDACAIAGEAGPRTERASERVVVREQIAENALREALAVAALDGLEQGEALGLRSSSLPWVSKVSEVRRRRHGNDDSHSVLKRSSARFGDSIPLLRTPRPVRDRHFEKSCLEQGATTWSRNFVRSVRPDGIMSSAGARGSTASSRTSTWFGLRADLVPTWCRPGTKFDTAVTISALNVTVTAPEPSVNVGSAMPYARQWQRRIGTRGFVQQAAARLFAHATNRQTSRYARNFQRLNLGRTWDRLGTGRVPSPRRSRP